LKKENSLDLEGDGDGDVNFESLDKVTLRGRDSISVRKGRDDFGC